MSHNHITTNIRLPEECPSCKTLWDILEKAFPDVRRELEHARDLREEYGEAEMLNHLESKREFFQIQKWRRDRYS